MKKMFMYAVLALIVVIGTYQIVMAGPRGGCGNGENPPTGIHQVISFVKELKLTDDQVIKITALIQTHETSSTILEEKSQTNKNKLELLQWSKDFTTEKAEAIQKEMQDSMTQMQLLEQKLMVDIKSLLTTEQLELFNKLNPSRRQGPGLGNRPGDGNGPGQGRKQG